MNRVLTAFIISPLILVFFLSWVSGDWWGFEIFWLIAAFITTIVGLPMYFLFKQFGWLDWWQSILVGLLGGMFFGWLLFDTGRNMFWLGLYGASTALIFWWLAIYKNPNIKPIRSATCD